MLSFKSKPKCNHNNPNSASRIKKIICEIYPKIAQDQSQSNNFLYNLKRDFESKFFRAGNHEIGENLEVVKDEIAGQSLENQALQKICSRIILQFTRQVKNGLIKEAFIATEKNSNYTFKEEDFAIFQLNAINISEQHKDNLDKIFAKLVRQEPQKLQEEVAKLNDYLTIFLQNLKSSAREILGKNFCEKQPKEAGGNGDISAQKLEKGDKQHSQ